MINDLSDNKWAIMVCLNKQEDDWIFVTEDTGKCNMFNLQPVLFHDINDALKFAKKWTIQGKEKYVKVVSYND
jgi:hypothetical protein